MEVAESREQTSVGPEGEISMTNGERNPFLDDPLMDDGRSSSLSEIDDVSDNEPSDFEDSPKPDRALENDSEAETERIEDSPHNFRKKDIVLSAGNAGSAGPSPSKLHQSTTLADVDDDEPVADDSPSKMRRTSHNDGMTDKDNEFENMELPDSIGKKRKRPDAGDETGTEMGEEEPLKKRRNSIKSDLSDPDDDEPLSPEPMDESLEDVGDVHGDGPADEVPEADMPTAPAKGKKGKKGKRNARDTGGEEEVEHDGGEVMAEDVADGNLGEDEEPSERVGEPEDAEAAGKAEEELAKKTSAMESLSSLEKEFATLRDKIFDEKIAKLDRELETLRGPNPTHPEYMRQIECLEKYRDSKINYEATLYRYRVQALVNQSLAERAQIHSAYFQSIRDVREKFSSLVSKQFYAIQHDRFKTDELSPHHIIPFPTRRSQQIAHQTAYNHEVSVMAGVAKYVGFPAAPTLLGARPSELDDDLEKMGITVESRVSAPRHASSVQTQPQPQSQSQSQSQSQPQPQPRGAMSAMSSNVFRTAAEEAFLEQTPWANPQHPIHQQQAHHQYHQPHRPHGRPFEATQPSSFATPAAQKRVVNVNAPNGSASTIPENASAANSSANNTPYGVDHDQRHPAQGAFNNPDYETERKSGLRSQSSSPLDVRKAQLHPGALQRSPIPESSTRNPMYSPPPRQGLFQPPGPSKSDASPHLPSKTVDALHYRSHPSEISGSNQAHLPPR